MVQDGGGDVPSKTPVPDGGGDVPSRKPVVLQDLKAALLPKKISSTLKPLLNMNAEGRSGFRMVLQELPQNDMEALDKTVRTLYGVYFGFLDTY